MGSILIKGGRVVSASATLEADVLLSDGKISAIGSGLLGEETYDASGCYVFPGFLDAHTHLDLFNGVTHTADDFYTGTKAALFGGTTTILDFATQEKGETLPQALSAWHQKADGRSCCDYGFHMAITDWTPAVEMQLADLVASGVTSFKLYLAYDALRVRDGELYQILKAVQRLHGIVGVHCENGDLVNERIREFRQAGQCSPAFHPLSRPDYVEAEAVARYCYIAQAAGAPIHIVHLSTKLGLEEARRARARGQRVYIESCPQYLTLDESRYGLPGFEGAKYVCSPPLRSKEDVQALWEGVQAGEIDSISTDHCSFNFRGQKELGLQDFSKIPNGLPGLEHRPALIYTAGVAQGRMTVNQMAALLSENAARLFGLYPRKGAILPGSDADLVVWDPLRRGSITAAAQHQNCDYTPYEGMQTQGAVQAVFLRGEKLIEENVLQKEKRGIFLARQQSEYFPDFSVGT